MPIIIKAAITKGLDFLAITNHKSMTQSISMTQSQIMSRVRVNPYCDKMNFPHEKCQQAA